MNVPESARPRFDAALRDMKRERADALRAEASELRMQATAKVRQAQQIEHHWNIPAPCHVCERRGCTDRH